MASTPQNNTNNSWQQTLLDWTAKQGRILTDEGKAIEHYCSERGFPFASNELPHYHLERGDSHEVFHCWAAEAASSSSSCADQEEQSPIVGAWSRPLFTGTWEHSTDNEETVYNIQARSLFIDLRIPTSKPVSRWEKLLGGDNDTNVERRLSSSRQAFEVMSDEDLRLYARQHVFAGYSVISREKNSNNRMSNKLPLCTRHHCIDWNYVNNKPRPRPNKWYIEGRNSNGNTPFHTWKEWSYATDENGQCYYWEKWERISGDELGQGLRLAMRKKKKQLSSDAILVAVGDHFNYIVGRESLDLHTRYRDASNTVELVDLALQNGDRDTAISHLSLAGGHGTISSGWKIDCALQPWHHGKSVFDCLLCNSSCNEEVRVIGNDSAGCMAWEVVLGNDSWDVYECSLSRDELQQLLLSRKMSKL